MCLTAIAFLPPRLTSVDLSARLFPLVFPERPLRRAPVELSLRTLKRRGAARRGKGQRLNRSSPQAPTLGTGVSPKQLDTFLPPRSPSQERRKRENTPNCSLLRSAGLCRDDQTLLVVAPFRHVFPAGDSCSMGCSQAPPP